MGERNGRQIFQVVCVVHDLDRTLENWKTYVEFDEDSIKLDSSREMEARGVVRKCVYEGREIDCPVRTARFNLGGLDLKLVQPLSERGDPYSDVLRTKGQGFHHLGICMEDRERAIATCTKWGRDASFEEIVDGEHFFLFDLRERMGFQFEPWSRMVGPCGPRDAQGKTV